MLPEEELILSAKDKVNPLLADILHNQSLTI